MSYQSGSSSSVKPSREGDNLTLTEQEAVLLDDIEAATKRIFNQVGHAVKPLAYYLSNFCGLQTPNIECWLAIKSALYDEIE